MSNFQNVNFQIVNFQNVDFQNVNFQKVDFKNVDFIWPQPDSPPRFRVHRRWQPGSIRLG
jgi:hypothetical protein